ncbi:MAG: YhgE/Pip family protein, partial [Eubacteriales bacterium]
ALSGQIIPALGQINTGQQQLSTGIRDLRAKMLSALKGDGNTQAVIPGLLAIRQGLDTQVIPGIEEIAEKSGELTNGLQQLSKGTSQLYSGLVTASDKVQELSAGAAKMHNGNTALADGIKRLQENLLVLNSSLKKMTVGAGSLNTGLQKTSTGLNNINNGIFKTESGHKDLGSGIQKIKSGQAELTDKLKSAAEKAVKDTNPIAADKKAQIIARPINIKDESIHRINSYGSGFAPYFIPLSLWVGALMIFFVINPKYGNVTVARKTHLALGKYLTAASISVAQATVTSLVIRSVLHLPVTSPLLFYLFNILQSLVYVAIIQFLVTSFGIAGRFVALVFLMLQLTSAGGTFPVELVPRFFQVLNPILPMSYGVTGLREIISGANPSLFPMGVLILIIFGLSFLLLTLISYISPLFAKLNVPDQVPT